MTNYKNERKGESHMFIQMKNAKKGYGKGENEVHALDDTELALEQGKIYVILGPSGSGKSTLLNMLGGLDSLDSGTINVDGREISQLAATALTGYRRTDVGFVFQFYNLIPDLTVQENIQVVSDIVKKPLPIADVMQAVDIEKYKDRFPNELSGGQQQRVAIARAIIKNPKLLLCDELTGALDSKSSRNVLEFVEKINQKFGTTVAIVTHNEMIAQMADGVVRIKDGKVISQQTNDKKVPAKELQL